MDKVPVSVCSSTEQERVCPGAAAGTSSYRGTQQPGPSAGTRQGELQGSSWCHSPAPSSAIPGSLKDRDVDWGSFRSFEQSLKDAFMFPVNSTGLNAAEFTASKESFDGKVNRTNSSTDQGSHPGVCFAI